ncbi:MAG TPA: response regulator [Dissulfurispiraceae bacterium]|nr:response regulator [Dissulfurispiraceae bacterium]
MTRIIVVDDNEESRYLLERLFKGHNYEVICASNGAEALEKARQFTPDIIVSDILMPVMDGYALCRQWKADSVLGQKPFIFYTATYTDPKDESFALSLGAERFVVKPVEPEMLEGIVSEVLARQTDGPLGAARIAMEPQEWFLKDHNEVLFRKLEKKMSDLEQLNQSMAAEISERKRAEEALKEQQMFSASLIFNSATATFVLDKDHRIMLWNKACEELTGCKASDMIGTDDQWKPFSSGILPTAADEIIDNPDIESFLKLRKSYWKSALNPKAIRADGWFRSLGGKDRYIVLEAAPIFDSKGDLVAAIQTLQDITQSKRLEEQLLHAQKMEAIGLLAGGVAHDFNNILCAIVGYAHMTLLKLPEDDLMRVNLEHILKASDRASTLTQSLLSCSRKQMINRKPVNISSVVKKFEKFLKRLIREDISIVTSLDNAELMVNADEGQIEQILMNLVTNAKDAMPNGGRITIKTETMYIDEGFIELHGYGRVGKYALLMVSDTGEGFDSKIRDRIFEPFFTTKEPGKGTGLGLSTAYGIVKQHDGYIEAYSELGKGAAFKIYFPLCRGVEEEAEKGADDVPVKGGTETILLAEDDAELRKMTSTVLGDYGYKVIEAIDGAEAVTQYKDNIDVVQLVILDGVMPRMSGKDAYEEIRNIAPSVKTIITTGYSEDFVGGKGFDASQVRFVLKPFSPSALLRTVRGVLDS